jgi:hypothetical protein
MIVLQSVAEGFQLMNITSWRGYAGSIFLICLSACSSSSTPVTSDSDGAISAPDITVTMPDVVVKVPDIVVVTPDVAVTTPDVAVAEPDVAVTTPDVIVAAPDVIVPTPDVIIPSPDVIVPTPDVIVPSPDVAMTMLSTTTSVYVVPPRSAVSTYDTGGVEWTVEGDRVRLGYSLPRLLLGAAQRVSFSGPYSPGATMTLTGSMGTATCVLNPSASIALRCDERFVGLTVDLVGVRREAMRVDPSQVDARVAVSERFTIEPIGVLEVPPAGM